MGDCGSYLLGSSLSIFSILAAKNVPTFTPQSVIVEIPIFIIGIIIIDMTYVICMRIREKKSPFYPDQRHLHYKFLKSGLRHNESVYVMYSLQGFFVSLALISINYVMSLFLLFFSILLFLKSKKIRLKLKLFLKKI